MQRQRPLKMTALLLVLGSSAPLLMAAPSPILQDITNFLSGVRYVPPANGGLFAPTNNPPSPEGYAAPADAYSAPSQSTEPKLASPDYFAPTNNPPAPEYVAPKANDYHEPAHSYGPPDTKILAFNGAWISSTSTPSKEYLVGDRDMTRGDAAGWCEANGGRLAEIPEPAVQQLLASMMQLRGSRAKYWLAIRRPFHNWEYSSRRIDDYSDWAGDYLGRDKDCAVLNAESLHWEVADCSARAGHRGLCERDRGSQQKQVERQEAVANGVEVSDEHCVVAGVRITLDNWLNRLERINSTAACHAACIKVSRCNFWTWNSATKRCYMKEDDGVVVKDEASLSGTTLHSKGCNRDLVTEKSSSSKTDERKSSRIEYCSCGVSPDAFLNPRSLPFDEDNSQQQHLGRLIRYTACPFGQELVCTDDINRQPALETKSPVTPSRSNITDCIVYDMKLAGDQHVLAKLRNVADAETCAASCISTTRCNYWTWRGDLPAQPCILLAAETEAQRRPGTASGTVRKELGCVLRIVQIKQQQADVQEQQQRQEESDDCTCELDPRYAVGPYARSALPEEDNIGTTEIADVAETTTIAAEPEAVVGQGRIVNIEPVEAKQSREDTSCPAGYVPVCAVKALAAAQPSAALWSHPLLPAVGYGRSEEEVGTGVEARIGREDRELAPVLHSQPVRFPTD